VVLYLSKLNSDTSIVEFARKAAKISAPPTHRCRTQLCRMSSHGYFPVKARTVGRRPLPEFSRKGSDGLGPALPQGWVVPYKPLRVQAAGLRPYSRSHGSWVLMSLWVIVPWVPQCLGLTSRWVVPSKRELVGHQGVGESLPHAAVRRSKLCFPLATQGYPDHPLPPVKVDGPYCGPTMLHAVIRSVRQLGLSHRSRPAAPLCKQFGNDTYSRQVYPKKVRLLKYGLCLQCCWSCR